MALRFIGVDPDSPNNGSPTVWLDEDDGSIVIQGWKITMTRRFPRSRQRRRSLVTRLWSGSRRAWRRFSWRYAVTTEPVAYGLLRAAERSAAHMEVRDVYTPEDPDWLDWQAGRRFDPAERWASWSDLIRATVAAACACGASAWCPSRSPITSGSSTT